MGLQILNGRIVDPANKIDQIADLFVEHGTIIGLGQPPAGFMPEHTLDASEHIVIPGLVDLAARLREPGLEHKATIFSETRAAAAGGITSLCCPPDTEPVADSPAEIKLIQQRANTAGYCHVYPLGALTAGLRGEVLSEMAALKRCGCAGVSNALKPLSSSFVLRRALEYVLSQQLTVFLHPIDHALSNHGCVHEGAVATRLGLPGIPTAAETAAIAHQLALIEQIGVRTHFCRLSTCRAVELVGQARDNGLPISADVPVHQLFLTEQDTANYNSYCHTIPPLRTRGDMEGLRSGVSNGAISAICSDHQPHELDAKQAPFPSTEPGLSSLETLLPLTLRLVNEQVLHLADAIALITCKPAEILRINAGTLNIGSPADICVYHPDTTWELTPEHIISQGKNTPFLGWNFKGKVTYTVSGGKVVYDSTSN
jgi:dihydroorotase